MRKSNQHTAAFDRQIGRTLRTLRQSRGLSQERVAALLGVTFQQVQKYENGANRLPVEKLYRLHRHFGVPLDYFFAGQDGTADAEIPHPPLHGILLSPKSQKEA